MNISNLLPVSRQSTFDQLEALPRKRTETGPERKHSGNGLDGVGINGHVSENYDASRL
jgi:hypothetical protein